MELLSLIAVCFFTCFSLWGFYGFLGRERVGGRDFRGVYEFRKGWGDWVLGIVVVIFHSSISCVSIFVYCNFFITSFIKVLGIIGAHWFVIYLSFKFTSVSNLWKSSGFFLITAPFYLLIPCCYGYSSWLMNCILHSRDCISSFIVCDLRRLFIRLRKFYYGKMVFSYVVNVLFFLRLTWFLKKVFLMFSQNLVLLFHGEVVLMNFYKFKCLGDFKVFYVMLLLSCFSNWYGLFKVFLDLYCFCYFFACGLANPGFHNYF